MANFEDLAVVTYDIATQPPDDYVMAHVVRIPPNEEVQAIWASTVYLVPGEPNPRLRRAEITDLPDHLADECIQFCSENTDHPPALAYDAARGMAERFSVASDKLEAQEPTEVPFKILALLAVYGTKSGELSAYMFSPNSVVESLSEDLAGVSPTLGEDVYRRLYATRSEHESDIAPFEKWKATAEKFFAKLNSNKELRTTAAISAISYLLIPHPKVDAIFEATLFE